jgi:hypothetical protein
MSGSAGSAVQRAEQQHTQAKWSDSTEASDHNSSHLIFLDGVDECISRGEDGFL